MSRSSSLGCSTTSFITMKRAGRLVVITVSLSRDFRLKCNFRRSVEHGQKVFLISEFVLNGIELLKT